MWGRTSLPRVCPVLLLLCTCWTSAPTDGAPSPEVGSASLPQPAPLTPPCLPLHHTLHGPTGDVSWTEEENLPCTESRKWILPVPPGHGIVLHVRYMHIRNLTYFQLYSFHSSYGQDQMSEIPVKIWNGRASLFPITIIRDGVMFTVKTSKAESPLSTFNISYAVYPLNSLPHKITKDSESMLGYSEVMFNCSTGFAVPEAMACDGVKHCVDDEDEEKCEYRQQGCEDWIPSNDQCLKVIVALHFSDIPGHTFITFPLKAMKVCQEDFGATLATLPDDARVKLVAAMVHQSGKISVSVNLRKVKPVSKKHEHFYRYLWQWGSKGSPIAYEMTDLQIKGMMFDCAVFNIFPQVHFVPVKCYRPALFPGGFVCMKPNPRYADVRPMQMQGVQLQEATHPVDQFSTKRCADGSVVQIFHQCQWQGNALSTAWSPNHFPLFYCQYGPPVHYSLLCDGVDDCADGSDERGCKFPQTVSKDDSVYICENYQVIPKDKRCDGVPHCFDESDEQYCTTCRDLYCPGVGCVPNQYSQYLDSCSSIYPMWISTKMPSINDDHVLDLDGHGLSKFNYIRVASKQLEGHVQCSNGIYIPSFLINNGELDCPLGEDENIPPENFTCPGVYRCQYSGNCVHSDLVCDGIPHCPSKDDERYCNLPHPSNCTCEGHACSCDTLTWPLSDFRYLRYLDLSGVTEPFISELNTLDFLQLLNVSFCQLRNVTLVGMPQLRILDLSYNILKGLSSMVMENLSGLTHLNISNNPLVTQLDSAFSVFITRSSLINIQHLVMTDTELCQIEDSGLSSLAHLVSLDIRKNQLEKYSQDVFQGLHSLQLLQTDESRLCCPHFHHKMPECQSPIDELSSCSDLLRLDFFRVFLWLFSFLTILGNSGVLVYHVIIRKRKKFTPYRILVSHLCLADFLMGVYMLIIGAADAHFRESYVANERTWRQSGACLVAGLLAFISSEMSAFIISLITLDRLLMLCFPFKFHLHLTPVTSMKLSCLAWALGLLLAAVPLMGQLEFYGESSICLPLPITRHQFSGQAYAFLVFIVVNFLLFGFIGVGQLAIYWAVQKTKSAVKTKRQEEDSSLARRLFLVVFSDFCCWFPVGLMGLLAFSGVPIPGEVSVWVAVFVLPINSALNPFLYTLSSLREKWNIRKMNQKSKIILSNLKAEFPKLAPDIAEELMVMYLGSHRGVKMGKVSKLLFQRGQEEETSAEKAEPSLALVEEATSARVTESTE